MSKRNIILFVIATLIAAATAMALKSRVQPVEEAQAPAPPARILIARRDIPPGAFVKPGDDLDWANWPADAVQPFHVREGVEDINSYAGSVARRGLKTGEPVTSTALVKPGAGGFLSAVLEPGKRAVSFAVTATSGNAGFVFPGDKVDLIVTHRVRQPAKAGEQQEETVVSETFVEDVRVVAVDQSLDNPENKAILAKTVTVEVTPEQAQRVAVAEDLGKISVVLRSLATGQGGTQDDAFIDALERSAGTHSLTRDSDISGLSRTNPRVRVIRGGKSDQVEFNEENP